MAYLHTLPEVQGCELHHFAPERRSNDAAVYPVSTLEHRRMEDERGYEAAMREVMYQWAAERYFVYALGGYSAVRDATITWRHWLPSIPERGEALFRLVLERVWQDGQQEYPILRI